MKVAEIFINVAIECMTAHTGDTGDNLYSELLSNTFEWLAKLVPILFLANWFWLAGKRPCSTGRKINSKRVERGSWFCKQLYHE